LKKSRKFKVIIPYFDSGTKKEHIVEFSIDALSSEAAVMIAKAQFDSYENLSQASWVRIIREEGIKVEEIS